MAKIFSKVLRKTDIGKRLSVPSRNKKCFLNFDGRRKVEFKAIDMEGKVWEFVCSTRKEGDYPKPVLSKGWLDFVRWWKLAVGDEVILYWNMTKGHYVIEAIKTATQRSGVLSPPVQNHNADETIEVANYNNNVEEEPTLTSNSSDQAVTSDQTEGLHNRHATDRVGLQFEFINLKHQMQVIREPKFINFFELGSQDQREKEQTSSLHLSHRVESHITSLTAPYFKFL